MPTKKYVKRRYPKRSNFARRVQAIVAKNIETKYHLTEIKAESIQDSARTPYVANLTAVSQGDQPYSRTGNSMFCTGIYGKVNVATADTTNVVRMIIYIPKDATQSMTAIDTTDFVDLDAYTVLYDKYFTVGTGGPAIRAFTIKRSFTKGGRRKGIRCQWHGEGSTDFIKNPIKMYVVSDSAAVSDPVLNGHIRAYFKDA